MVGMIGRKLGMMRLYDGAGRARAVTVIELGPNRVTQLRTTERDGYEAVQIGFAGNRKRVNRPERGHLRAAGVEEALTVLQEFPLDGGSYERGQTLTVEAFTPGEFVNVSGVSKGRGFAGGVKRWNFRGGPKTHGQSDRHRAPGSVGAGTTPGKVWKGQKMAGHMGAEAKTIINLLVVLTDPARNLIFVEGSVPGADEGIVTVEPGRRGPLKDYTPPVLHVAAPVVEEILAPVVIEEEEAEEALAAEDAAVDETAEDAGEPGEPAGDAPAADTTEEGEAAQ
ncbi:MAG: 50S ribosomal protein L3 [Dehalococcoidia bacterium]|nr:50S ribosomal protein L3 [Dehalococcoidia bacterium]